MKSSPSSEPGVWARSRCRIHSGRAKRSSGAVGWRRAGWVQRFTTVSQADQPHCPAGPGGLRARSRDDAHNFVARSCSARRCRPRPTSCKELPSCGESLIPCQPAPRRLPHASDLLDSIMVLYRTRVIPGCGQMGRHIPPVAPPAVVHRTENVKRRQRAVDETRQSVQLRRFASFRSHH